MCTLRGRYVLRKGMCFVRGGVCFVREDMSKS